jgi:polyhydroxybutyrate depolymerase
MDAESGTFDWRGTVGPSTTLGDFGSPQTTTGYSVCAWDGDVPVLAVDVPEASTCGAAACWSAQGSTGLRYRDGEAVAGEIAAVDLKASSKGKTKLTVKGPVAGAVALPLGGRLTVQLLREDSELCWEGAVPLSSLRTNEASEARGKVKFDAAAPVPALASGACGGPAAGYTAGISNLDSLVHDGLPRTFRVYVPASYDDASPVPVVFLLHGGFGSGAQIETSSRMLEVAEAEGFVVVSPDGVAGAGGVRTWNGGYCCGYAVEQDIDDVGFVSAMIDRLEASLCIDRRRVFATGMSNGAMLSHRLACDLGGRIAAVAPVAGTDNTVSCDPLRPVPVLSIHGSADANVPYDGGLGCGPSGVSYRSVPVTIARWQQRDDCADAATSTSLVGDATCSLFGKCAAGAAVESCVITDGGHQWPGGEPPATSGFGSCPFAYQSQEFSASQQAWEFFSRMLPR